jgi:hypothetical protein
MYEIKLCEICGSNHLVETHHIIKRKQAKYLENCKLILKDLCWEHHKGTYGVHGKYGHALDQKLKADLQRDFETIFGYKEEFTREDIRKLLEISVDDVNKLCRTLKSHRGVFYQEDIIRAAMGGKLIIEEGINNEGYKNQILGC